MNTLREVSRDLRANRTRAVLSGTAMFLAVAAIIAIMTAGSVANDVFVAQEEQANGRAATMLVNLPAPDGTSMRLTAVQTALNSRLSAHAVSYAITAALDGRAGSQDIERHGGVLPHMQLIGVAGRLDQVRRLPTVQGRWLFSDTRAYPPEAVLNEAAAADLGSAGQSVSVQAAWHGTSHPTTIVGVVADGSTTPTLYLSLLSVLAVDASALDGLAGPVILAHRANTAEGAIRQMLSDALHDIGSDPSNTAIIRADHVDELQNRLRHVQAGFLLAALVSLLVAVIGLINIGLASVRERSRELVVRRAIGATRSRLFAVVLLSAVAIAVVACSVAVATAFTVVKTLVPHGLSAASAVQAPAFPWSAAAVGLAAAVIGAAVSAAYPAAVAARVDVALALRD